MFVVSGNGITLVALCDETRPHLSCAAQPDVIITYTPVAHSDTVSAGASVLIKSSEHSDGFSCKPKMNTS